MPTKFIPILADSLDIDQLTDALVKTVKEEAKFANTQFGLTYKTWKNKPDFDLDFKQSTNELEGSTLTSDKGSKKNPYPFVTKGTPVRFATMTPDFVAKTKVRTIGSGAGRGGVAYIDKRKPRPGIEGREFEPEIAEREQPKFEQRGQKNLDQAARRSNHAI